jgi:hypothetical protein
MLKDIFQNSFVQILGLIDADQAEFIIAVDILPESMPITV